MTREEKAAANRAAMPETAQIIDEFRRAFGAVKIVWAEESGIVVGKKPADKP